MNDEPKSAGRYLTFQLGSDMFGVAIELVREINQFTEVTPVSNAPVCVTGIVNLRDKILPVLDLRLKLGLSPQNLSRESSVIILNLPSGLLAAIVDSISAVVQLSVHEIELPLPGSKPLPYKSLVGIGRLGSERIILLDISLELEELEQGAGESSNSVPASKDRSAGNL